MTITDIENNPNTGMADVDWTDNQGKEHISRLDGNQYDLILNNRGKKFDIDITTKDDIEYIEGARLSAGQ